MKLEYLYQDETYKSKLSAITLNDKTTMDEKNIDDLHIFSFSMVGENLDNAKQLCELKIQIESCLDNNKLILLYHEAAEFLNRKLYPEFNKFERLLRKVLFLISVKNQDNNALEIAKKLEVSDFGDIYESVFTSKSFRDDVKIEINKNTSGVFSKKEILNRINQMQEETIWSKLFSNKYTYVSDNFPVIKKYRNDIMHAHNITYADYLEASKTITKANEELEKIILRAQTNELPISVESAKLLGGAILAIGLFAEKLGQVVTNFASSALFNLLLEKAKEISDQQDNTDDSSDNSQEEDT